eukprot:1855667-Prorocentrum_lima.AAC.1
MFGGVPLKRFIVPVGFMNMSCANTQTMRKRSIQCPHQTTLQQGVGGRTASCSSSTRRKRHFAWRRSQSA